jgi:dolichol-phosphate mannosyltransferase
MERREDVCVLLPTLNEAETIGSVVEGFREAGYGNVLVVDGGSSDGTRRIAEDAGARVLVQSGNGKGQAVREGVRNVEEPVVLMADGDGTYDPADADAMLEPIFAGRAEHVIGDRFYRMADDAMPRLNRAGNRLVNRAFAFVHGRDLADILSGYRAFTRESFERLRVTSDGFGIETELAVECVKHGVPTEVVGVSYGARPDDSETNLHPIKDGARIYLTLFRLAKTNNPLFYFGSVGVLALLAGLAVGGYVGYEWFLREPPVSHEALAVVSAAGIILGVQLLMFGVLSDVIVAVNREQTRRIEELAAQLGRGGGRASTYRTGWNGTETDAERSVTAEGEGTAAEMGPESGSESPTTDR